MGLKLFVDGGGCSDGEVDKIEIDNEFARRFEHNKKREDLQRLAEFKKKGIVACDSDSDESLSSEEVEEEDGGKKKDLEFFDALIRVKNQDPILKNKEAKLFASEDENGGSDDDKNNGTENDDNKGKKENKPMYLKDVMSKHLIEEGPEFDDDEGTEEKVKTYSEEQEELRKEFLKAVEEQEVEGNGDGGELLREKIKRGDDNDDYEDVGIVEKLDEYFGADEKLDKDTIFLKDYFRKRMWLGKCENKWEDLEIGGSEDEDEIERQEDYEREYNFRFEENAGDRVLGHSRVVEDSVRKKPNARKLQRERKEERMAQAEFERKEELKHLKNVKKKEMIEKLGKIRETAGIGEDGAWLLEVEDLEEEFNPDEHDKKMKKTFDESYYQADDIDPDFGSETDEDGDEFEMPDFDKEDELLGLSQGWDDANATGDGSRERVLKQKMKGAGNHEQLAGEEKDVTSGDAEEDGKRKRKRKRKLSEVEKAVREELMEEYNKLEYEDTIGDLKTRFQYKSVKPRKYGLDSTEILAMDDKELNQCVSLKKLAPYRENEWKVPRIKTYQQRQKIKNVQEGVSNVTNTEKPSSSSASSSKQQEEMNADTSNLSRRIKRRRRLAELKLSRSTLMAYGKISAKPKSKKKP